MVPLNGSSPLPTQKVTSLFIENSQILKIKELPHSIQVLGKKEGFTHIKANSKTFSVWVLKPKVIESYYAFQKTIKPMMGPKIEICQHHVCITGEILTLLDYKTLYQTGVQNELPWILKSKLSPQIQADIQKIIETDLQSLQFPKLSLKIQPIAQVRLPLKSPIAPRLEPLLLQRGFLLSLEDHFLSPEPIVDLKVEIVEFKKSSFTKVGLEFPGSYKASIIPQQKSEILPFEVALHNLEQNGDARIMASPRLSCRSGEEAQFLAGGEFPIRIMNYKTNDIQWKKHGILLKFKPQADLSGFIRLSLTAEVSLLDTAQTVDGVPGLLVNRVESHVDMKTGDTLSLSGLIKKVSGQSTQGLHTLSQIPILGLIFGSQDYRNDQSDLVIFVSPVIL